MSRVSYNPKRRALGWGVLGAVACYTLAGFYLLPRVVQMQLEQELSAALGGKGARVFLSLQ